MTGIDDKLVVIGHSRAAEMPPSSTRTSDRALEECVTGNVKWWTCLMGLGLQVSIASEWQPHSSKARFRFGKRPDANIPD